MRRSHITLAAGPLLAGMLLVSGCSAPSPETSVEPHDPQPAQTSTQAQTATLVYFHDAHEIGPVLTGDQDRGGVARLATAIDNIRSENPATAVIFGGDLAGGTLFGGLYKGFPMVEAFNTIGVDLANFGQHDFDFGVDNTRDLVAASNFPWITSNIVDNDGDPFVEGGTWAVQQVGELKIGFIGLTDAIETTSAADQLDELSAIESAAAAVAEMTASEEVDVIIAVTQHPMDSNRELARAVPEVGAIFGEEMDEYDAVVEWEGDVPLMAPEGNMGSLIRLDISKEGDGYVMTPTVVKVNHTVDPDPVLLEVEKRYEAEIEENLSAVLATVETPLLNPDHASSQQETALGNFVADAFREFHDTQLGWINGGGLRAEAPGPEFTTRNVYAISPFDNKVMAVRITGAALVQALEQGVADVEDLGGGFPQVSGFSYAYSPSAAVGSRVSDVLVAGEPVDPEATYSLAVTNYVVGGGDGVTGFTAGEVVVPASEAPSDAEAVIAHATSLGVIDVATEGRVTVLP